MIRKLRFSPLLGTTFDGKIGAKSFKLLYPPDYRLQVLKQRLPESPRQVIFVEDDSGIFNLAFKRKRAPGIKSNFLTSSDYELQLIECMLFPLAAGYSAMLLLIDGKIIDIGEI